MPIHRVYEMRGTMFHELQGAPLFSRVHNVLVCDALFICLDNRDAPSALTILVGSLIHLQRTS
jgi:hypothetical protein